MIVFILYRFKFELRSDRVWLGNRNVSLGSGFLLHAQCVHAVEGVDPKLLYSTFSESCQGIPGIITLKLEVESDLIRSQRIVDGYKRGGSGLLFSVEMSSHTWNQTA